MAVEGHKESMKQKAPIAIVGMSGLFPGALKLDTFWQNIINKVEAVCDVPEDRWIVKPDSVYDKVLRPDRVISKRACLIKGFQFDSSGINLDKGLLDRLDPLYHLVLQAGKDLISRVIHNSTSSNIDKERIGTVLAAIALPTDSASYITREILGNFFEKRLFGEASVRPVTREEALAARVTSLPAAIIAEAFNLGGGTLTLDAACASSIYAVKIACDELYAHRADLMLAGGVSRPESLFTQVGFSQLMALSPSGRCAPFDESADGLVVGEGIGILALKRLDDAIRDRDEIFGVIRGIGLSNDMNGNLLAPDTGGQLRAMESAHRSAGLAPWEIDLVECHGTGTPLGDAAELMSLRKLWGNTGWFPNQCALGSVKSMIGHLLTGAGAAGMIKILLALKHKILPPSLNFTKAPANSPLHNSPFRVQTEPEPWVRRKKDIPLRAAVSAFGFGGINAQILLEEWDQTRETGQEIAYYAKAAVHETVKNDDPPAIAVVGMEASFGSVKSLKEFRETILRGESIIRKMPKDRWRGSEAIVEKHLGQRALFGGFAKELSIDPGEFHIPPNEISEILIQQLLMLKVAAGAMEDAGLNCDENRTRMGVVIGVGFDFETTDFNLRWNLINSVPEWKNRLGLVDDSDAWLEILQNQSGPPLTAAGTVGALGGIVASRIAREFNFGGPSFVVSGEETSGLKALEIGIESLVRYETDAVLAGAVDLACDVRNIINFSKIRPFTMENRIYPFDRRASGTLPGEGAAAVILKRLDQALNDGDRIYSVIKGTGSASCGGITKDAPLKNGYLLSLKRAFCAAKIPASSITYYEAHGSGVPGEDNVEAEALNDFFTSETNHCALGSVKANIGHTGAAAGFASFVKTSFCLFQEIIPPLVNFQTPVAGLWEDGAFHIPAYPQYWLRNGADGPRRACIGSMTTDGNFAHLIVEGFEDSSYDRMPEKVSAERKRPLGFEPFGLFLVDGETRQDLLNGLDLLGAHIRKASKEDDRIEYAARAWHRGNKYDNGRRYAVSIAGSDFLQAESLIREAREAVLTDTPKMMSARGGVCYSPEPSGIKGKTAFIFPGSGNHYVGMGRCIGVIWPEILREMDRKTGHLKTQLVPECYVPLRFSWEDGWEQEAYEKIVSDPLHMIFGQVVYGGVVTDLVSSFGIRPSAVIGYSLGESAGLFAMGAWPERGEMLKRMQDTDLFRKQLAGRCTAARSVWNIPDDEDFDWYVVVVNRPADIVRDVLKRFTCVKLLIVNTPEQSVLGGKKQEVKEVVNELGCDAVSLDGVVTVHCEVVKPVADSYRNLHLFPVNKVEGVAFYSCASGRTYELTPESAADSILNQALHGFDFNKTINSAYSDGVRNFIEIGPHSSCTGMIAQILGKRQHSVVSASSRFSDDFQSIIRLLGKMFAERIPFDMNPLYCEDTDTRERTRGSIRPVKKINLTLGGTTPSPVLPEIEKRKEILFNGPVSEFKEQDPFSLFFGLPENMASAVKSTADAHKTYLDFSADMNRAYSDTFAFQARILTRMMESSQPPSISFPLQAPAFSRERCMEFATGSLGRVLGPEFAVVDSYKARVRLPDEPLMLVDRIISVQGEKGSLGSGQVVTEHDVLPGAWYINGGRAPACISIEAGQADLFLCSYLGIDLKVKGERTYRLLDACVQFHRGLPVPGDVIRYYINIEKFVRQNETYLFFFNFKGFIENEPLITMTEGCAGFFTEDEVKKSGGIVLSHKEMKSLSDNHAGISPVWEGLVPHEEETYDDTAVDKLREGDLEGCFGSFFAGIALPDFLKLPGGRMKLVDRIVSLDPRGGSYGLGIIRAEVDIHPDDWFLTCHFVDDMVMPGTLMYECCFHTLRIFIQRMGWITEKPDTCYEPVIGVKSILKCRGPVTPRTKHVIYEVEIKETGYDPEPYVIADANIYADQHHLVRFTGMSLKMTGITGKEIEAFWSKRKGSGLFLTEGGLVNSPVVEHNTGKTPLFDRNKLLEFALGKPSEAFGERYLPFDTDRFIARLPGPPFLFIDRITRIEPEQWLLKPGGWIEAEYDVPETAWYFNANKSPAMPFSILLEVALQSCGWLAAYSGSALKSKEDLKFRNLDGKAQLYDNIFMDCGRLVTRSRLANVSEAGNMIIEQFDFTVLQSDRILYEGETTFGFFSKQALAMQVGLRDAETEIYQPSGAELDRSNVYLLEDETPFSPNESMPDHLNRLFFLSMPAKAIKMIDRIDVYVPDGGPHGLGFIRGSKKVNSGEWFFKAHFYQDPVMPGSLGIESFIQLLKFAAIDRWSHRIPGHRFELITDKPHVWTYRGQILPDNKFIEVEAVITSIEDSPLPVIMADGYLKVDGLYIYKVNDLGIKVVPIR